MRKWVTVSHVLPRGKYLHLALSRDNVQVRCRSLPRPLADKRRVDLLH